MKHNIKSDISSEEEEIQVDNKYTTEEEEKEEEDTHEVLYGGDIGEKERPASKKSYRGNFSQSKEEYGCPYGSCGRKFVSVAQLKQHVERRHAPNIPAQEEVEQIDTSSKPKMMETPIQSKMKNPIKSFQEDNIQDTRPMFGSTSSNFFKAAPRPVTSHARQGQSSIMSQQQSQILNDIISGGGRKLIRPQTAATSTKKDEDRIKKQLKYLEQIEEKIENDLAVFSFDGPAEEKKLAKKGVMITKQMLLESSHVDEISEIHTLVLRDKKIEYFEDNKADGFKLESLVNIEAIFASHNMIKELFGISQLTTLVELNLSFNNISDVAPLEDLVLLEKLWINRNHILLIDPLKKLKKLRTLGLFHNEIMNDKRAIEVLEDLPQLTDLSIDGNPVSSKISFKYELIYRFKNLETLDDDAVKELDRDIAEQYFIQNRLPFPGQSALKKKDRQSSSIINAADTSMVDEAGEKENGHALKKKKSVKFASKADEEDEAWQSVEIKKLEYRVTELLVVNEDLREKLEKKKYDEVYRENEMLKLELKNMYCIQEENKDLREDLDRMKSMTYEDRMKEALEENKRLRRRNGELIIKVTDIEEELEKLKGEKTDRTLDAELQMAHLKAIQSPFNQARPQTSGAALGRRHDDIFGLEETTTDDFDKELNDLILKNQQRLAELQSDIKEVSKQAGEPVINIRKIKQVRTVKPGVGTGTKTLNIKTPGQQRVAMVDEVIDDA